MNAMPSADDYEELVRERAHQLWEAAGRPEGLSDHFWYEARAAFEREHLEAAMPHAGDPQPVDAGRPAFVSGSGDADLDDASLDDASLDDAV